MTQHESAPTARAQAAGTAQAAPTRQAQVAGAEAATQAATGVVIALDGPSGSGKSTVGRHLAQVHALAYLDTGAMYRAITWYCRDAAIDLADAEAVARASAQAPVQVPVDPADQRIFVGDVDVSEAIRSPEISTHVSAVATNLAVRAEMRRQQRAIIDRERTAGFSQGRGIVAEGRDITTVVAPDAEVRILLVARAQARVERRARELYGSDDSAALAATVDQVVTRDAADATVSQFTVAADGVVTLDSSTLSLAETLAAAEQIVRDQAGLV